MLVMLVASLLVSTSGLLVPTAATFLYCVLGQSDMGGAADLGGFIVICGLQTLAIGYLAYN